jgi:hypothetical protein
VGFVNRSISFSCSMIEPGQPWLMMIGSAFVVLRADVDEVDVQAVDLGDELRQSFQLGFDLAPVVIRRPVARELLHQCERHALGRVRDGLLLGPARGPRMRARSSSSSASDASKVKGRTASAPATVSVLTAILPPPSCID